jgi:hypothetical protein
MPHEANTGGNPARGRAGLIAFLVIGSLLVIAAGVVGIADNPPGILLCYGGITSIILAFVHRWRTPRSFFKLLGWSFLGFVVAAVLHNVLYGLGHAFPGLPAWILWLLEAAHVAFFLIAVLLCPPGFLVGLFGYLTVGIWKLATRRQAA